MEDHSGPYWPKSTESEWDRAREERRKWQEEQAHLERMRQEDEQIQRLWEEQLRKDLEKI